MQLQQYKSWLELHISNHRYGQNYKSKCFLKFQFDVILLNSRMEKPLSSKSKIMILVDSKFKLSFDCIQFKSGKVDVYLAK